MTIPNTKTGYSTVMGGGAGFPNQGTWNTTLTATGATAKECVGILRTEGPNTYVYAQIGTGGIGSDTATACKAIPVTISTGLTDTQGYISPLCFSAVGATADNSLVDALALQTMNTGLGYGWFFVQGIFTAIVSASGVGAVGGKVAVSTNSARTFSTGSVTTANAIQLEAAAAGCNILCFMPFTLGNKSVS